MSDTPRTDEAVAESESVDFLYGDIELLAECSRAIELSLSAAQAENARLREALELPLLFHSGGEWGQKKAMRWYEITKTAEATSRIMCDHIRALGKSPPTEERK